MPTYYKICSRCKQEFPFDDFYKSGSNGRRPECKSCSKKTNWYNSDNKKEYDKQRHHDNLAFRSRHRNMHQEIITTEIETESPSIDIWLLFDTHYANMDTDIDYLQTYQEWLKQPDRYTIMGGDLCEYSLVTGNTLYISSSNKTDLDQINWLKERLRTQSNKNLIFLVGNHERRYHKNNPLGREYDIFKMECDKTGIPYIRRQSTYLEITVNGIKYLFLLLHGDGISSYLPTTPLRTANNARLVLDGTDFIIVGHSHHNLKDHEDFGRLREGNQIRTDYPTKFIRPGSFLVNPEYARRDRNSPVGNVILRLFTQKKYSLSFRNLNELQDYDR